MNTDCYPDTVGPDEEKKIRLMRCWLGNDNTVYYISELNQLCRAHDMEVGKEAANLISLGYLRIDDAWGERNRSVSLSEKGKDWLAKHREFLNRD